MRIAVARVGLAVGLLVGLALVAACRTRPDRVVVGVGMASNVHRAMAMAAREINASGGIGGLPLELDGLDSDVPQQPYEPRAVLALAHRFAANPNLVAVVGHSDSSSTLSAAAVYNAEGVPQIVTIATNPAITGIGVWTYRLCLSDAAQGPALAEYAVNVWKKRRLAVIFVNDAYGSGLAEQFERRARELGASVVATVMHRNTLQADDQETIRLALARMKSTARPDLIALFQRIGAAEWTVRAIRDAGVEAGIIGGDNLAQHSLVEAGSGLADGIRVSQFFRADPAGGRGPAFVSAYRAMTGVEPDYAQAFSYDAVYLLKEAVLNGGSSRAGVKAYLDRLIRSGAGIDGVGGRYWLRPNHDARRPLHIAEVREGRFELIDSLPAQ